MIAHHLALLMLLSLLTASALAVDLCFYQDFSTNNCQTVNSCCGDLSPSHCCSPPDGTWCAAFSSDGLEPTDSMDLFAGDCATPVIGSCAIAQDGKQCCQDFPKLGPTWQLQDSCMANYVHAAPAPSGRRDREGCKQVDSMRYTTPSGETRQIFLPNGTAAEVSRMLARKDWRGLAMLKEYQRS